MSPFAVDEDRLTTDVSKLKPGVQALASLDPAKPPVKTIPHAEFPCVVYKHPREPFRKIEHRNAQHELVNTEILPSEHKTKVVACAEHVNPATGVSGCTKCKVELEKALKEGWVREPYLPKPLPDPNAELYEGGAETLKADQREKTTKER